MIIKNKKVIIFISLLVTFLMILTSCNSDKENDEDIIIDASQYDLMTDIFGKPIPEKKIDKNFYSEYCDFTSRLLTSLNKEDQNIGFSTVSISNLLLGIADGANGKTRSEITSAISDNINDQNLNLYFASYINRFQLENKIDFNSTLLFNSKNKFSPKKSFLQMNADYHGINMYSLEFSELYENEAFVKWLSEESNTDIDKLLDENFVNNRFASVSSITGAFEWENSFKYYINDVFNEGENEIKFLISDEDAFISLGYASGFQKSLKNGYKFVALMPNGGNTVDSVISMLNGSRIERILENVNYEYELRIKIPSFEYLFNLDLKNCLIKNEIISIFDESIADLNEMGDFENTLFLNQIKTILKNEINENGIYFNIKQNNDFSENQDILSDEIPEKSENARNLDFNSPFIYFIFDNEGYPIFVGKVAKI